MSVYKITTPNKIAVEIAEKYLQGNSYSFIEEVLIELQNIAKVNCKLPTLTEEN